MKDQTLLSYVSAFFAYDALNFKYESSSTAGALIQRASKVINVAGKETTIYTHHEPVLASILDSLRKGRLSEQLFPFVNGFSKDK